MDDRISRYIKFGTENIKQLRETLKKLKREQKEASTIELKHEERGAKEKKEELLIHFSLASVAKATIVVLLVLALGRFVGEISQVLLTFFIAILFSAALNPTVRALERRKIPRPVSVLLLFLVLLLVLGFFVSQLIPLVATQLLALARSLTSLINKITEGGTNLPIPESAQEAFNELLAGLDREAIVSQLKASLEQFASQLEAFAGDTFAFLKAIFNGIFNFVLVLILTFFLVVNERSVNDFFVSLFPSRHGTYIVGKIKTIQEKIGYWLRGQVILMLLMFGLSLIGLLILGIDNALTLAMMTGIAELLPVVGPIAAGIPAILVGFNESPWLAVWVLGLIILLQQIEGNILVPLVMRRAVGLSPIVIILAMMIGLQALGIVGMILAIPVATTLSIFVKEYAQKEK